MILPMLCISPRVWSSLGSKSCSASPSSPASSSDLSPGDDDDQADFDYHADHDNLIIGMAMMIILMTMIIIRRRRKTTFAHCLRKILTSASLSMEAVFIFFTWLLLTYRKEKTLSNSNFCFPKLISKYLISHPPHTSASNWRCPSPAAPSTWSACRSAS